MKKRQTTLPGSRLISTRKVIAGIKFTARFTLAAILGLWAAIPFLWILTCSFRPTTELFTITPQWLPKTLTFESYFQLFQLDEFVVPLVNTIFMATVASAVSTFIAILAAHSLLRYRYPGQRLVAIIMLLVQMLPFVLLLLPLFILYNQTGLYNTRLGLIIAYGALTVPYSVLMLRAYFGSLPMELEDAAMIDGCSKMHAFWIITIPLASPALAAILLTNFITVWGDVQIGLFLAKDTNIQNISLSLYKMTHTYRRVEQLGLVLAMGVIITLPITFLFMALQKFLVMGLTAGALKA